MLTASSQYKEHMKTSGRLRNQTYIRVTIGLINQQAQSSAFVPKPEHCTYYSNLTWPLDNYEVQELYATCDQNYTPVDGSIYFLPRSRADVVLNQGIVSENLRGPIEIRFPVQYDIKGLTIEFGKSYPVDFIIESDNNTVEITGNRKGHFVTEEIFEGATFLRFVPLVMVNGQSRSRIHKITMGIGIYFDNQRILSATKKEHVSPVMEELPTIDFSLTVNNKDRAFDIENEESSVNFLELGQDISVLYGQELDDGSVEWLPGAKVRLKEWSADDEKMNFSASDRFEYMDGTYHKGLYRPDGISLYDLAVDVFSDAGIDSRTYWIDRYLKSVKVSNPMPVVSHKEALQLIANAGRCILYQDREGNIFLKSSFIPDMESSSDNETYFSHTGSVLDKTVKKSYALATKNFTSTTPAQYFLPSAAFTRYSPNANGSNMTTEKNTDSQYVGIGYMPREVYEHENLFINSDFRNGVYKWEGTNNSTNTIVTSIPGYSLPEPNAKVICNVNYLGYGYAVRAIPFLERGDYVLSSTVFAEGNENGDMDVVKWRDSSGYKEGSAVHTSASKEWVRLELPVSLTLDDRYVFAIVGGQRDDGNIEPYYAYHPKLERGNVSTPWTPAPSDWLADPNNYKWVPIEQYAPPYLNTGYISEGVAGSNGAFEVNPTVEINLEASYKCFGLKLEFGNNNPQQMVIHTYLDGKLLEDYTVTDLTATTVISHEFEEFDKLVLEFTKGYPNNRVLLNNITFGDSTDYIFKYGNELTKTPKGTQLPKVRELQVIRTLYNQAGEKKELAKETIMVTDTDNRYTFYFSNPSYDLSCALTEPGVGQTAAIVGGSNYFATVEFTGVTGIVEISITGREYTTVQTKVSRQLNPTGKLEVWDNPLVSDTVHAANLADWIGDYMKADREYDLQYRGDPRLDANDIAFLENKYVPDLLLRVYEHTLKFNGALSGTIKARRDMSNVAKAKD